MRRTGGSSSSANRTCIRMLTDATSLTWNVPKDVTQLFEFHFMLNAFRAGSAIAVAAAVIGWFAVLRQQTFAGHSLAVIGFPGAAAAVWLGLSASIGFYAFCLTAALTFSERLARVLTIMVTSSPRSTAPCHQ